MTWQNGIISEYYYYLQHATALVNHTWESKFAHRMWSACGWQILYTWSALDEHMLYMWSAWHISYMWSLCDQNILYMYHHALGIYCTCGQHVMCTCCTCDIQMLCMWQSCDWHKLHMLQTCIRSITFTYSPNCNTSFSQCTINCTALCYHVTDHVIVHIIAGKSVHVTIVMKSTISTRNCKYL